MKTWFIKKGEYRGEAYETKPFYSSVLTASEVEEFQKDFPTTDFELIEVVKKVDYDKIANHCKEITAKKLLKKIMHFIRRQGKL